MRLGFLETLINCHIKTLDDGTKVFYPPQGAFGRHGYIVPSEESEAILKRALRRFYVWLIVSAFPLGGFIALVGIWLDVTGFVLLLILGIPVECLAVRLFFRTYTKGLERKQSANSPLNFWVHMGQSTHRGVLGAFTVLCLLFAVGGFVVYGRSNDPKALLCGILFSILLIPYLIAIWGRVRR